MNAVYREVRPHSTLQTRGNGFRPARYILILFLYGLAGCAHTDDLSQTMVASGWHGNPWGPSAQAARLSGTLDTIPLSPPMLAWERWGKSHLRDGDLIFRMGNARLAFGLYPFSQISADIAGSRYSHSGIIACESGEFVVYDTTKGGPRRQPFAIWVMDSFGRFAIKRPRAEFQHYVPAALAYCREVHRRQIPFDPNFTLGDDQLYCIELTERAYQVAGLNLSKAVRIDQLPRYHEFPLAVRLARIFSSVEPDNRAYVIGNESVGIWSSPNLELLYESPESIPVGSHPLAPGEPLDSPRQRKARRLSSVLSS